MIRQTLDVKKFSKLKNLEVLSVAPHGADNFINYNTKNFQEIIKLKKIKDLNFDYYQIYDFKPEEISNIKSKYNKKIILNI